MCCALFSVLYNYPACGYCPEEIYTTAHHYMTATTKYITTGLLHYSTALQEIYITAQHYRRATLKQNPTEELY